MELKNCKECGNLFQSLSDETRCYRCKDKEEQLLREISRFIRRNKNRVESIEVILENFDVTKEQILKWVREKRLLQTNFKMLNFNCKLCKKIIRYDGLCEECSNGLKNDLKTLQIREEIKKNNEAKYYSKED